MKTINYQQLTKMIEPGKNHPVIINTLPKTEFEKEHIPGSMNIPAEQISQKAPQLLSKHDWIVVYCACPTCEASHEAGESLEKAGFTNIYHFPGGMEEWRKSNNYVASERKQAA